MKIRYRNLNSDETYCCYKKDIDILFHEIDVDINFGYRGFRDPKYNSMHNNKKYAKRGAILLLTMALRKNYELLGIPMKSSISIYIIKKDDFNQKLKDKFKEEILPKMFDLYSCYCNDVSQDGKSTDINVWLKNDEFYIE